MLQSPYEVEDTVVANFKMTSGGNAAFFTTNCYVSSTMPEIAVVCEHRKFTLGDELLIEYDDGHFERYSDPNGEASGKRNWSRCHIDAIRCFYDCSKTGEPFQIGSEQAIRTIRLIDTIYRSAETGT